MASQNPNLLHSNRPLEKVWYRCDTWDNWYANGATYQCIRHGKSANTLAKFAVPHLLQIHSSKLHKFHHHPPSPYPFGTYRLG